jgi:hypothetical protein
VAVDALLLILRLVRPPMVRDAFPVIWNDIQVGFGGRTFWRRWTDDSEAP